MSICTSFSSFTGAPCISLTTSSSNLQYVCIDDEEYIAILRPLLQQKRRSVKAHNDYELRQKLIKFAIGRGFTMNIIKQCISIDDEEEYDME